jgi:hypothetical protein
LEEGLGLSRVRIFGQEAHHDQDRDVDQEPQDSLMKIQGPQMTLEKEEEAYGRPRQQTADDTWSRGPFPVEG